MRTLIGSLLILGLAATAYPGVVTLKENSVVDGERVTLGRIAKFEGIDPSKVRVLEDLVIGTSPLPGRERVISLSYIKTRILTLGEDAKGLMVRGPDKITIKAASLELDPKRIIQVAKDYLSSHLKDSEGDFKIKVINTPRALVLPPGKVECEVIPKRGNLRILGPVYIDVSVLVDGVKKRRVRVGFDVHRFQRVVVAKKTLPLGSILKEEDLIEEVRDTTTLVYHSPIKAIESVVGKRTKRAIKEGTILTHEIVEVPPLIRRGSIVTIHSRFGNVHVRATGKALRDGRKGERIIVRNLSSKQSIEATVVEKGVVIIRGEEGI
jgi:flagella basal body P-ring formation protein FlgA